MGIRIPKNQTVESKYTSGKEYMFASTQNEYKGPYYEINGKTFAGEKFNPSNPEIIKIQSDNYNSLLGKAATYVYGKISGVKLNSTKVKSIVSKGNILLNTKYFVKKFNSNIIKEVDESEYNNTQKNPLYQTVSINFPEGGYFANQSTLDEAEKQMPGIKAFIEAELPPD